MPLLSCRVCKKSVSTEANTCPHCGAPSPTEGVTATKSIWNKKLSFKDMGGTSRLLLALFVIGMIAQAFNAPKQSKISNITNINVSTLNACFDKGDAIATVYFSNIKYAVEVGVLGSEMMEKGCLQSDIPGEPDCLGQCRAGFRYKAKQLIKESGR